MASRSKTARRVPPGKPCQDPVQAAIDYGIDIQALMDNLKRTPTERLRRHDEALGIWRRLRKRKPLHTYTVDSLLALGKKIKH